VSWSEIQDAVEPGSHEGGRATPKEIAFVEAFVDDHAMGHTADPVVLEDKPIWVCRTIAEALDHLRPGCWLRELSEECRRPMSAEHHLPIFKQGDDLAEHLEEEKDWTAALLAYADRLKAVEQVTVYADRARTRIKSSRQFCVADGACLAPSASQLTTSSALDGRR
jgi:hypothetical protein